MSNHFTLRTFTPAEVEQISGLSTTMQRDWRRRGFLPSGEGHARFNAFELADVRLLKLFADGGVGPAASRLWKRAVAYCVVSHALRSEAAYSSQIDARDREAIREAIVAEEAREEPIYTGTHLPANTKRMILTAPRYALWWGETGGSVGNSLDRLQDERPLREEALPAFNLDIHGAADDLLRLAGHLVNVTA